MGHDLSFGILTSRVRNRFQDQAYNYVGTGNVAGTLVTPADPSLTDVNTNRDERIVELSAQDAVRWNERFTTWVGLRHTRLSRDSVRTDGSRPTGYDDGLTTPWLATSYLLAPGRIAYASYGEGVESQIVPNRTSQYTNAGVSLPSLKSKQWELGFKGGDETLRWQAAWFHITRPVSNLDACNRLGTTPCLGGYDGEARHQGLEGSVQWSQGPWRLAGGAMLLDAKRQGSTLEPANVPDRTLRAQAGWRVAGVEGLELQAGLSNEGRRAVLPDGSIELPSWTRTDAGLRYDQRIGSTLTQWTLSVDNLFDRRYWKESPYQYGHVYLYPGAARTFRVAMRTSF